jgi:hypothetical protein
MDSSDSPATLTLTLPRAALPLLASLAESEARYMREEAGRHRRESSRKGIEWAESRADLLSTAAATIRRALDEDTGASAMTAPSPSPSPSPAPAIIGPGDEPLPDRPASPGVAPHGAEKDYWSKLLDPARRGPKAGPPKGEE